MRARSFSRKQLNMPLITAMAQLATSRFAKTVAITVFLLCAWMYLLPSSLGGRTSLIVTQGSSMQPGLKAGDLVVVHKTGAARLQVGDVVLYPSKSLRRFVLHRIHGIDERGHLIMKGDNNNFLDPDHPARNDVIGKKAFAIPAAGRIPGAGSPVVAGIMTALIVLVLTAKFWRRRTTADPPALQIEHAVEQSEPLTVGPFAIVDRVRFGWAAAIAIIAIVGAVGVGVHALRSGGTASATGKAKASKEEFRHSGSFSYQGREPNAAIAADHKVSTGDAVFTNSTKKLNVAFDYELDGKDVADVQGTGKFELDIEDDNGWHITEHLDDAEVSEGTVHLSADLDLQDLRSRLRAFERASKTSAPLYRLRVRPLIELEKGPKSVRGATFAPMLTLVMDAVRLRPETLTGGDATAQYHPTAVVGEGLDAAAAKQAPRSHASIGRPVLVGVALLLLFAGLAGATAVGGDAIARDEREIEAVRSRDETIEMVMRELDISDDPPQEQPETWSEVVPPPQAPSAPLAMRERLRAEGVFFLPTSHMSFDRMPIYDISDLEEFIALAKMAEHPVILHGTADAENWICQTGSAYYVYSVESEPDSLRWAS
jgi:signal peptidase